MTRVPEFVAVTQSSQIASVARLAHDIWNEHYLPIIGQAQIDYMLQRLQSEAAIAEQITQGDQYFLIRVAGHDVGYLAIRSEPATQKLFISKLYIDSTQRGQGLARATLDWLGRTRSEVLFWLVVNKRNPACQAYQRLGFRIVAEVVTDIGAGFVMDDYRMEWQPAR